MKILQILPTLQMGGVERGTIEIARALVAAGIPNGVVSEGGAMTALLAEMGVPHHVLPVKTKNPFQMRRNARAIADLVAREGYTLVHVRSRAPAWSVKWAARRGGFPWLATYHGVYGTEPRFLKIPYNRVMLAGARTICVSDFVKEHILANYRVDPAKLERIWRGADVDVFRPEAVSPARAADFRRSLGFPDGLPLLVLPGRLTRIKGQLDLLDALPRLKNGPVGCLFVGTDQGRVEYSAELKARAAALTGGSRVAFLDHSDDMPLVYAASDLVISATRVPESFGRTIPEAQAMERLALGTAHGGACETVKDGETGFLTPPGDPVALAAKIDEILALPQDRRAAIARAARASVCRNFSTQAMCAATLALYRELAAEPRA